MKNASKKEFNRFMKVRNANPGLSTIELHGLYLKDKKQEEMSLEANVGIWTKEFITNKIK